MTLQVQRTYIAKILYRYNKQCHINQTFGVIRSMKIMSNEHKVHDLQQLIFRVSYLNNIK